MMVPCFSAVVIPRSQSKEDMNAASVATILEHVHA
jgi:hypothetical protein